MSPSKLEARSVDASEPRSVRQSAAVAANVSAIQASSSGSVAGVELKPP